MQGLNEAAMPGGDVVAPQYLQQRLVAVATFGQRHREGLLDGIGHAARVVGIDEHGGGQLARGAREGRQYQHAGVGGIADQALLKRYIEMGVRLVLPGSDLAFLQSAASATAAAMRGFL